MELRACREPVDHHKCCYQAIARFDPDSIGCGVCYNAPRVVQQLKTERDRAAREVTQLDAALAALNGSHGNGTGTRRGGQKRRKLSPEAIDRIRKAQRLRWKKFRAAKKH